MGLQHNYLNEAGKKPKAVDVKRSELVVNVVDKTIYSKDESGNVIAVGGGLPQPTGKEHQTVTTDGTPSGGYWSPFVTSPNVITEDFTIAVGASASIVSPTIPDNVTVTIPDGSILVVL